MTFHEYHNQNIHLVSALTNESSATGPFLIYLHVCGKALLIGIGGDFDHIDEQRGELKSSVFKEPFFSGCGQII